MKRAILFLFFLNFLIGVSQGQNKANVGDTIGIWQVINFDSTYNFIHIDTSSQNLWQVGAPQKTYFNSAYSPSKAIVTDTVTDYPVNNHSYFDLYIGTFNNPMYTWDIYIDFWHKYNTDTLKDGGYISVSWDKGLTWMNIIKDSVYGNVSPGTTWSGSSLNLYTTNDTLYNGEYGFSGKSNGWVHSCMAWDVIPCKFNFPPDTMIVRFNFISDSINNPKEGWMIDNIRLFSIDLGGGIHDLLNNNNTVNVFPNPFNKSTEISFDKNYERINLEIYDMQGKFIGMKDYSNCNKVFFNRNELNDGLYLFKIKTDNNIIVTKRVMIAN